MENDINKIIGYYIHRSIVLPNNKYALQLKKDLLSEEANLLIMFNECLTIDDVRINDVLIEDISNQKNIGMLYIFMARNTNRKPEEYNQLIIFDKKSEKSISTGVQKKAMLNIIYKDFNISEDIYSYKEQIKENTN